MADEVFQPGPRKRTVRAKNGAIRDVPAGWVLLAPGDAALTRRVKKAGEFWPMQERKGRRMFSRGIWAPQATIESIQAELEAERSTEAYARKREATARRRDKVQQAYVEDFLGAVLRYLDFHPDYGDLAVRIAEAVTAHATPVGSGTVARTRRISVDRRAQAAIIAWMRHQTTGYDSMRIPRVKGKRREVRQMLAARSKELLRQYRKGIAPDEDCPLQRALAERSDQSTEGQSGD